MKKILLVLTGYAVLYVVLAVLQSCDGCDDGPINFKLHSISAEVNKITGKQSVSSIDYFTLGTLLGQSEGTRYDSIGIEITHNFELLSLNNTGKVVGQAFACDPVVNYEILEDITVTSSRNYTDAYPAGADLSGIISVRQGHQVEGLSVSSFLLNSEFYNENIFITFNEAPSESATHNLTITYNLANGRKVETSVPGITINK